MTITGVPSSPQPSSRMPAWVEDVYDSACEELPTGALQRGRQYADSRMVVSLHPVGGGRALFGVVRGNRRQPYHVMIHTTGQGIDLDWDNTCTCPMESDCKHVVAALLDAVRASQRAGSATAPPAATPLSVVPDSAAPQQGRAGHTWHQLLQSLTGAVGGSPEEEASLALLLDWPAATAELPPAGCRVILRPMRRGATGRWVKSGVSWGQFRYGQYFANRTGSRAEARAEAAALQAIDRVATAGGNSYTYYNSADCIRLDSLGSHTVRLLADAVAAGVQLVTPIAGQQVVVSDALATLAVDVRAASPHGVDDPQATAADGQEPAAAPARQVPLSVAARVRHDGRLWDATEVALLGEPASVLFRRGDAPAGVTPGLVIAPVTLPSGDIEGLLSAGRIEVPADEAGKFFTGYYPALRRRVEVLSSDASVRFPEPQAPRLRLQATYGEGHRVHLAWSMTYGDEALPLRGNEALRDPDAERIIIERCTALIGAHVSAPVWRDGSGRLLLRSGAALTGMQTAAFSAEVLPVLDADPDVDVLVIGEAADYGASELTPTVHLDVRGDGAPNGQNDWFSLDVQVRLGEQEVPFRPLFAALCQGDPHLLLDSGTWFSLDLPQLDQLRQLIEEARELSDGDELRISRWQAGLWDELADIAATTTECAQWRESVGGLLADTDREPLPAPPGLQATLRPYQLDGFQWLTYLREHQLGGVLADDMGLGKTMQALAALEHAKAAGQLERPALVIAPTSVIDTWCREAARFTPGLRVRAVTQTSAKRREPLPDLAAECDIVVTSYAIVRIDADSFLEQPWSAVLLDEAQAVKNPRAKTHQVVRSLNAPTKIAITGTPLENSLLDLWALLSITAPGLFPKLGAFVETYRKPIENEGNQERLARLQRRVRPLMLRRTKEAVAPELPPKQEQVMRIDLAPAHRRAYDRRLQRERQRVLGLLKDFDRNRVAIFRSLTVLRQLALAPVLVDPEHARIPASKVEAFAEQIAQVAAEGHRALVFSQFTGFLGLVRERLAADGIEYAYLDGRTRNRPARIQEFRDGDAPVFLISLKAGGFGLTLTEADYVFLLDPWWNPAAEQQAVDRTHRIGQDKTVMVYRLIAADTIEDKVVALQQRKRDLFANVIDAGGAIDTMLTADDIRGLLQE
ncbi:superfamily II DNA or RNA helicase [Kineosphaera limosa]|nr:DEAD/DEAH box helicase [Kineosphaera limosa]NYE00896.1 superfamily II DNA or RNA helicase [Kineosphaera limosa]